MIDFSKYRKIKLVDIADVQRGKNNQIYEKGTIYIQVSALSNDTYIAYILEQSQALESKYVVVNAKTGVDAEYLYYVINRHIREFIHNYIQNINLTVDSFKHMCIDYHDDIETQKEFVKRIKCVDELILKEEQMIEHVNSVKKNMMEDVFI